MEFMIYRLKFHEIHDLQTSLIYATQNSITSVTAPFHLCHVSRFCIPHKKFCQEVFPYNLSHQIHLCTTTVSLKLLVQHCSQWLLQLWITLFRHSDKTQKLVWLMHFLDGTHESYSSTLILVIHEVTQSKTILS